VERWPDIVIHCRYYALHYWSPFTKYNLFLLALSYTRVKPDTIFCTDNTKVTIAISGVARKTFQGGWHLTQITNNGRPLFFLHGWHGSTSLLLPGKSNPLKHTVHKKNFATFRGGARPGFTLQNIQILQLFSSFRPKKIFFGHFGGGARAPPCSPPIYAPDCNV